MRTSLHAFLAGLVVCVLGLTVTATPALAQYFGRNKVQYENFDFRSFRTENFEWYFYPEERQAVEDASRMGERWYRRHSRTFLREFHERKPIIFYANDADFQQTNVISGSIGQGTGGVLGENVGRFIIRLKPRGERTATADEVIQQIRRDSAGLQGVRVLLSGDVSGPDALGPAVWVTDTTRQHVETIESPGPASRAFLFVTDRTTWPLS